MTFAEAVAALREAGVDTPERDAQKLWEHSLERGVDFVGLIARRAAREPVSHIKGERAFWTSVFEVTPNVLDPRPDTETLIEAALAENWTRVLDLGTGSGCILLSLLKERSGSTGLGVDISEAALSVAQRNGAQLGVASRAEFRKSNWFDAVDGTFDLIVSNPPYITAAAYQTLAPEVQRYEPKIALTPGGDGLAAYRIIAAQASAHLAPGGSVFAEIGFDQADAVSRIFQQADFSGTQVLQDLNGQDRVVKGYLR